MSTRQKFQLWDLPTRLFHWLLVVSVVAAVITGWLGSSLMEWHARIGLCICGLIAFRIFWGVCGSTYARFAQFFPTPGSVRLYLSGQWRGHGHNPLGALSVFGLLALLALQVVTGLFSNDDITFTGPLYDLVGRDLSNSLTGIHLLAVNLLIALVVIHIGAIMFYAHVKKDNLVKPMITGWKENAEGESARGGGLLALLLALAVAAAAVYGASGAWMPAPPPPPPAAETPNW